MRFISAEWLGKLKTFNFTGNYSVGRIHATMLKDGCLWMIFHISNQKDNHLLIAFTDVSDVLYMTDRFASFRNKVMCGRVNLTGEFIVGEDLALRLDSDESLINDFVFTVIGVTKKQSLDEINDGLTHKLNNWMSTENERKRIRLKGGYVNPTPSSFNECDVIKNSFNLTIYVENKLVNNFIRLIQSDALIFNVVADTTLWITGELLPGTHICMGHSFILESGNKLYTVDDILDHTS